MHKSIDTASSQHQHSTHHLCQYFYSYMYAWGLLDGKLTNTNPLTLSSLPQLLNLTAIKTSCGLSWRQSCWSYKESYAWLYYFLLFCWLTDRTLTTNFIAFKPNCWDYFYPYICLEIFCHFSQNTIHNRDRNLSPNMGLGINSRNRVWNWVAKLHRLAGWYNNPMPTRFLAIPGLKFCPLISFAESRVSDPY
jgi:hypothetical protein